MAIYPSNSSRQLVAAPWWACVGDVPVPGISNSYSLTEEKSIYLLISESTSWINFHSVLVVVILDLSICLSGSVD